jgi:hypothetical protein
MKRDDYWNCYFYEYVELRECVERDADTLDSNYDCKGDNTNFLAVPDGANNLASIGWGTRIRAVRCRNAAV